MTDILIGAIGAAGVAAIWRIGAAVYRGAAARKMKAKGEREEWRLFREKAYSWMDDMLAATGKLSDLDPSTAAGTAAMLKALTVLAEKQVQTIVDIRRLMFAGDDNPNAYMDSGEHLVEQRSRDEEREVERIVAQQGVTEESARSRVRERQIYNQVAQQRRRAMGVRDDE